LKLSFRKPLPQKISSKIVSIRMKTFTILRKYIVLLKKTLFLQQ
jgi:hypothetical protein